MRKKTAAERELALLKLFKALGILSFIGAAVLITLVVVMGIPSVRARYDQYLGMLQRFERQVAALNNRWLIVIVILLLYLLRSLSAIYPYAAVYIMTAMVFSPVNSFIINFAGMAFTVALRFFYGVQMGEGFWNNVLKKYPVTQALFRVDARHNPLVLFALRMVPIFPFNTVSHLYGSFEYPFVKYMLISMAALVPRLVSYSFIGNSVYDPLRASFFVPLTLLFILTGVSFFLVRGVFKLTFHYSSAAAARAKDTEEMLSLLNEFERIDYDE